MNFNGINLTIFYSQSAVWEWHNFPKGHTYEGERCPGRIMRCFYPWKWEMIACKYEPEPDKDDPDYAEGKIGHAITNYDLTHPHLYYCMDCQQYGIRREREHAPPILKER